MKYLILLLLLVSCSQNTMDRANIKQKEDCFIKGGIEFQVGESGGTTHLVCVYKNKSK